MRREASSATLPSRYALQWIQSVAGRAQRQMRERPYALTRWMRRGPGIERSRRAVAAVNEDVRKERYEERREGGGDGRLTFRW